MTGSFYFADNKSPRELVEDALKRLLAGELPTSIESKRFDFKEDTSKRDSVTGKLGPGDPRSEAAAEKLAEEVAAMANVAAGGAFVIGVHDTTGEVLGCDLDAEWLERELIERLGNQVIIEVAEVIWDTEVGETERLLAILVPHPTQPVIYKKRYRGRTKERKVTHLPNEAHQARLASYRLDPSAQSSDVLLTDVDQSTRDVLIATMAEAHSRRYERASFSDLAKVIGAVDDEDPDRLNQAGAWLLATRRLPALDYIRRDTPGASSAIERINIGGRTLLVELVDTFAALDRHNPSIDVISQKQLRRVHSPLPRRSCREAIVNGIAHRDWVVESDRATVVQHIGDQLRVTSPGSLVEGITVENVLTHASKPRYPKLMQVLRTLGFAEQEGIGIDTIYRELITIGAPKPEIATGDEVTIVLNGRKPDLARIEFFEGIRAPNNPDPVEDVDFAIAMDRVLHTSTPWLTALSLSGELNRSVPETTSALERLESYQSAGREVLVRIGVPKTEDPAWALNKAAARRLQGKSSDAEIERAVIGWLAERGRISSTEYLALFKVSQPTATKRLQQLADKGLIRPSNFSGGGQSFHYLPAEPELDSAQ